MKKSNFQKYDQQLQAEKIERRIQTMGFSKYHNRRLRSVIRGRLNDFVKLTGSSNSYIDDLGCTFEEFKAYILPNLPKGMKWEDRGFYGWHFDHIKSLCVFDLTDKKQFKEASHYTNIQPLTMQDNFRKKRI